MKFIKTPEASAISSDKADGGSALAGFGSNTNTGTGFGASTTGNTGGSLFGGNASTGGFGSGGGTSHTRLRSILETILADMFCLTSHMSFPSGAFELRRV